ncbi:MAG: peptidase M16 [Bacteroidetes bacterium B1(2017)]|nr:MAG: peptidase M16 [Bacteroidetes bacterium B1(2017)]
MKKIFSLLLIGSMGLSVFAQTKTYQTETKKSADGKYSYSVVSNDPMKVRTYVLPNGLTVMMAVNKKQPRIQTYIATKAGSKNDPAENTGLAHYLEHMLFKGTDTYGTKDWAKEKVQLDKIDALYEQYNKTTDEAKRKAIYHQIDSVSGVASKFAIANEYDKLMQGIGAQGTNAFTSLEQTVYVNDIPENNIGKWIQIESERFRQPVLRLFHTELEAVYEEKNISLDNDGRKVFESMMTSLFKQHTYGTQTTIGTVEHLKNPSLVKIRNYYNTYYVPNNMAIVLSGDFDPDATIALIDKYFSYMQPKPVPSFSFKPEIEQNAPEVVTVYGPDAENLMIGYRMPGAGTKESRMMQIVDMILSNAKAGLIDLNLTKKQAVLSAGSSNWINKDYSIEFLTGKPKKDQTLEQVKDLLMAQIEKVKAGDFDENTLKAIIANLKVYKIKERESNDGRASAMLDAFTSDRPWVDAVSDLDEMEKITKAELVAFAKQYFGNNCVIVYKKVGEDKSITKIEKPEITPVDVNRDDVSPFVKSILETPSPKIAPKFIDFKKDITFGKTGYAPIQYVANTDNELFQLYYVLDMGKFNDLKFPMAVNLLQYLGTDKYTADQISQEFFKLACDFNVNVSNDQIYVSLTGLNQNFVPAVKLFEHLLANAKPDQTALNTLVERTLKGREDNKKNKGLIFRAALQSYAMYGSKNPFKHELSAEQLKALKADELTSYLKKLTSYQHKIWYFGPLPIAQLTQILNKEHKLNKTAIPYPAAVEFTRNETNENKVLFVDYNMVQAEVMWMNRSSVGFDASKTPVVTLFNEYFGGGMSSIVFQTIRESKALAYSTYSRYNTPSKQKDPYYIIAYIGTQADKFNDAIPAMNELLTKMPKTDNGFESAKASILNSIETDRTNDANIIFAYAAAQKLGIDHDLNQDIYASVPKLSYEDIAKFQETTYTNKPFTYCIMASKDRLKMSDMEKLGKVQVLTLEEIFGY